MELNVHDLLRINPGTELIYHTQEPDWVRESLERAPFVVVRRGHMKEKFIPVGIRGSTRSERFPALLSMDDIIQRVTPEQIAEDRNWIHDDKEIYHYLEEFRKLMNDKSIVWGPIGSVGFELVSGVSTVTTNSDIDIIFRYNSTITPSYSRQLITELDKFPVNVDIQVETEEGAFSLQEYAYSDGKPILFKTMDGPLLRNV